MTLERASGVLLHITSLPGEWGVGTLGASAYGFVDLLAGSGQKYWQILPLGPVSPNFGYSPYSALSSFAGNPLLIDPHLLQQEEWVKSELLSGLASPGNHSKVDFLKVAQFMDKILGAACRDFFNHASKGEKQAFYDFCEKKSSWLQDYALYMALSGHFGTNHWLDWDKEIALRKEKALCQWREKLKEEVDFHLFIQFVFSRQWSRLKEYCQKKGVQIIGDIPIYVNFDSADTWSFPGIFQLDEKSGEALEVAGVPPDYFSATGQRWGNPLYRWFRGEDLNKETMAWWVRRFAHTLEYVSSIRIDHFRGFESYWAIPAEEETAVNGRWVKGPGETFFQHLIHTLGQLPLLAEDLGIITPEVEQLRDAFQLPGMKVLQFAFDGNPGNPYLIENFKDANCVAYTGTHDSNTSMGWFFGGEVSEDSRQVIGAYLDLREPGEFHWAFIAKVLSSRAALAIIPAQDILGLGQECRMNTPGVAHDNWTWKLFPGQLSKEIMKIFFKMCIMYDRV